jgi:hypothetical protein
MRLPLGSGLRLDLALTLGVVLVGSFALAGCGGDDSGGIRRNVGGGSATPGAETTTPGGGAAGPQAAACPATVPAARALSAQDPSATELRLVNGSVIYQAGSKVVRLDATTAARSELYTSPDLVHSFMDDAVLVTIESPNAPEAVLKIMPAGGKSTNGAPGAGQDTLGELVVVPPGWNAGGTYVFASDATSLYILADVANRGDTLYRVSKTNPNVMTVLAQLDAPLGDPQLAGADVWFVRDQKRVYKVTQAAAGADPNKLGDLLPGETATPTEVFGLGYADCKLAVGGNHTFCSTGTALEQRDLTGGNLTTVFDSQKAAMPSVLGAAIYQGDTVFVRSLPSSSTDPLKNGIRAVETNGTTTEQKLVACGRDPFTAFAADATTVVWAEQGKGVFAASR